MPSLPKNANMKTGQGVEFNNAVLRAANIPLSVKIGDLVSLNNVGADIIQNSDYANSYARALVNLIAKQVLMSKLYRGHFAWAKKGLLDLGEYVQEIFVNAVKGHRHDLQYAESKAFKVAYPDIRSAYHSVNLNSIYSTTVTINDIRKCFKTWNGIYDVVGGIVNALYSGANIDEEQAIKYMIARHALNGDIYPVAMGTGDDAWSVAQNSALIKEYVAKMNWNSNIYNISGVNTALEKDNFYIVVDAHFGSIIDVATLATAFNLEYVDMLARTIVVDDFSNIDYQRLKNIFPDIQEFTTDEKSTLNKVHAMVFNGDFLQIYDETLQTTVDYVGTGPYWNYNLIKESVIAVSPFANACVFVEPTGISNTAITLNSGSETSIKKGTYYQFKATGTVTTGKIASNKVEWSVSESDTKTFIDSSGLFYMSPNESQSRVQVTAKLAQKPDITAVCTITPTA